MWCTICPAASSNPFPTPSTPTLLLMVLRFFVPLRASARIRFSGMPHRPKPPIMIDAPSNTSRMASSALATTLFIEPILNDLYHGETESWRMMTSSFLRHAFPQRMREFKFFRQLARCQIFTNVRQVLLQLPQCVFDIFLVADRDVTPHGVRARGDPRHL